MTGMRHRSDCSISGFVAALLWVALSFGAAHARQPAGELPTTYREEIVIHHDGPVYLTGDYLRFSVVCLDKSNHLLSPLSRLAYVELLDTDNKIVTQSIIDLKGGRGHGEVLLPFTANSGNYLLRAYTRWMRNFDPAHYAHTVVSIVNPFKTLGLKAAESPGGGLTLFGGNSVGVTVNSNKTTYGRREKVIVNVNLTDVEGQPVDGLVSLSVSKIPGFAALPGQPVLNLKPELSPIVPQAGIADRPFFLPEIRGQHLTGHVYRAGTKEPAADELIYLSITGTRPEFYAARSDARGVINFEIIDFYGGGELLLQPANPSVNVDIELTPPFSEEFATIVLPALAIDEKWESYLTEASQNMQVRNVYTNAIPYGGLPALVDTLPFYGIPDQRYFLDDYTRFPLMEEVLREYVSGILLRKKDNNFFFRMVDVDKNEVMPNEPLMLYDGMPVKSANKIVEADPRLVKRIDVITRRYVMGDAIFDGITSFHTYKGDLAGLTGDVGATKFSFTGVQPDTRFVSPNYDEIGQRESTLPDFRNTLFWSPQEQVTEGVAAVEFFTGDSPGTFLVEVNGISQSGALVSGKAVITVEK